MFQLSCLTNKKDINDVAKWNRIYFSFVLSGHKVNITTYDVTKIQVIFSLF